MRQFTHIDAHSVGEVLALLDRYGEKAQVNAGGTDLMTVLKGDICPVYPEAIINLKTICGLDTIRYSEGVLRIGAMANLADIASDAQVCSLTPALAAAAEAVASPQIRNIATLGGNLCQDTRCWYYRYPAHLNGGVALMCPRKGSGACLAVTGDNRYHAIFDAKRCFAVCPSDTAVALAALHASLVLEGTGGERRVLVQEFYHPLGNVMDKHEILTGIEIPIAAARNYQSFHKYAQRKAIDFALCSACGVLKIDNEVCAEGTISLGAVAPGPHCIDISEQIAGHRLTPELIEKVADYSLLGARPLKMNEYKIQIAKTLIKDALYDILRKISK